MTAVSEVGAASPRDTRSGRIDSVVCAPGASTLIGRARTRAPESSLTTQCSTSISVTTDRKSVVQGKSLSVRVGSGGRRMLKKKKIQTNINMILSQHIQIKVLNHI